MKPYVRITLAYLIFGILWILVSDTLAFLTFDSSEELTQVQVLKGWLFVFLSSVLIYYLTRQAFQHREKMRKQRRALFLKTVSDSYHILLNYLNQMQLVILEAEKSNDFDDQDVQDYLIQVRKKLDESARLGGS